jgi:hypothetical protein
MPSYAGFADGGGVDEGCQFLEKSVLISGVACASSYLDIFRQQSVEQVWVCGLEVDEVLELLDRRSLHSEESEAWQTVSMCFAES